MVMCADKFKLWFASNIRIGGQQDEEGIVQKRSHQTGWEFVCKVHSLRLAFTIYQQICQR
jgi:hypothetical protein